MMRGRVYSDGLTVVNTAWISLVQWCLVLIVADATGISIFKAGSSKFSDGKFSAWGIPRQVATFRASCFLAVFLQIVEDQTS